MILYRFNFWKKNEYCILQYVERVFRTCITSPIHLRAVSTASSTWTHKNWKLKLETHKNWTHKNCFIVGEGLSSAKFLIKLNFRCFSGLAGDWSDFEGGMCPCTFMLFVFLLYHPHLQVSVLVEQVVIRILVTTRYSWQSSLQDRIK